MMEKLASETIHQIIQGCGLADQKQLRLVCGGLSAIASEYVFRTVYLALLGASLERVRNVANHSTFSCHVRTLVLCPQLLAKYSNAKKWGAHVSSRPFPKTENSNGILFVDPDVFDEIIQDHDLSEFEEWEFEDNNGKAISVEEWIELPNHQLSRLETLAGFERYQRMYKEQISWLKNGFTLEMGEVVRRFPNLDNIEMPDPYGPFSSPLWRTLQSTLQQTPKSWLEEHGSICEWGVEQLTSVLESIATEGRSLKKLEFNVDAGAFLSQKSSPAPSPATSYGLTDNRFSNIAPAFAHLRDLTVDFGREGEEAQEADETVALRFAKALETTTRLEKLCLTLTQCICRGEMKRGPDFLSYIKSVLLPKLRVLHLVNIRTNESNLLELLTAHGASLKHLWLRRINLNYSEGSWDSIIKQLPDILSLEGVLLGSLGEVGKPLGPCLHVGNLYHLFDCGGPGWEEYYSLVVAWILDRDCFDLDDFPILNAYDWDELNPDEPALTHEGDITPDHEDFHSLHD